MFELKLENASGNIVNIDDEIKYSVVSVTGLNPPSASLFLSKSPNRKGARHNGSTLNERHVVITIKLLGDVEANRNALYDWIDTEQYIKIRYRNDTKNVYCEGYVEECDFDGFNDNEVVNVAITCANPYWSDLQEIVTDISSVLKQFTFPFSISTPVAFSTIKSDTTTKIFNSGAETGCRITIKCLGDVNNFVIYNAKDTTQQIKINTTLKKDWIVEIDTNASPKTIKAIKTDGTTENLLKYTGGNTTWLTLKKGVNWFSYSSDNLLNVEVNVGFTNKYLGV